MSEIRVAVITCSDPIASGEVDDRAGHDIIDACEARDWLVVAYHVCPLEIECISTSLIEMTDMEEADVVFTLGGTGLHPRDVTPEATERVCERMVPGLAELLRSLTRESGTSCVLSRATSGTRGGSLIVNLPGGPADAATAFDALAGTVPSAIEMLGGGSNHT